jgi:peptidoglycan/LPS O-acetylase OafA/YrhL
MASFANRRGASQPHASELGGQSSNLDILRAVAVLAVFLAHWLQVVAGLRFGQTFAFGVDTAALGRSGVLIFFVHTSLVLMQSLKRTSPNVPDQLLYRHFYIKRMFRIYPLSICLILVSIALSIPPDATGSSYRWGGQVWLIANLLLVQNVFGGGSVAAPLWTLPSELQMYLALPALFFALRKRKRSGNIDLIAIYLVGLLLAWLYSLFQFVPSFLGGVIAYKLLESVKPRFPAWTWSFAVLAALLAYMLSPYSDRSQPKDALLSMTVALFIPLFRQNSGTLATVAAYVAKYSYGIYLCHTPLLWFIFQRLKLPVWQGTVLFVFATGAVSVACYCLIEKPLIGVGGRLANRITRRAALNLPNKPKATGEVDPIARTENPQALDGVTG